MPEPRELVTVGAFAIAWAVACAAWTVLALAVGVALALRRRNRGSLARWTAYACLGPIAWGMWELYRRRIAYNPDTGVAGMHLVSVLLTNILIFVAVGAVLGYLAGRFASRDRSGTRPV